MKPLIIFLALGLMAGGTASGATPAAMTLDECVAAMKAANPSLKAAETSLEKARILEGTAFDAAPTEITLKQTPVDGGGPENGVAFSQEFEFPTRYVARHRMLKAQTEAERNRLATAAQSALRDLTAAYSDAVCLRHKLMLAQTNDSLFGHFADIAKVRFEAGEASRLEMLNAGQLARQSQLELQRLRDAYAAGCAKVDMIMGGNGLFGSPADTILTRLAADTAGYAFAATPEGMTLQSEIDAARRNESYEKQGFLPGITLGATVQALIKGFNPYDIERERFRPGNFMGFEVGINMPLFFGAQRARTRAAARDHRIARLRYTEAENSAAARRMELEALLTTAAEALDYYQTEGLAEADEMVRLANISYEYGEIDYVEYGATLERATRLRIDHADALNNYNQIVIELKYLYGSL